MAAIKVLDNSVSILIAAGEVVDRPASIVKELAENAVDSNATAVTIEIKKGGKNLIKLVDNGCGIPAEDMPCAFQRHATSKLRNISDLDEISTMGFRGEALASIAAVSKIRMVSRTNDAAQGVELVLHAGEVISQKEVGCAAGTTIMVEDVFYNTPARAKFMKSDAAETGCIGDIAQKLALANPDISFRFISNGREVFYTAGDGDLKNAIFAIYTSGISDLCVPACREGDNIWLDGLIGKQELSRPNRNDQIFFVNRRVVHNKTLSYALQEAYKGQMVQGRFPMAILNITIDPSLIDINVHPAKTEIKFFDERALFDLVYWGVKDALYGLDNRPQIKLDPPWQKAIQPEAEQTNAEQTNAESTEARQEEAVQLAPKQTEAFKNDVAETAAPQTEAQPVKSNLEILKEFDPKKPLKIQEPVAATLASLPSVRTTLPESVDQAVLTKTTEDEPPVQTEMELNGVKQKAEFTVVGQLFSTYILVQKGDELLLIDQHAAHERQFYSELTNGGDVIISQTLLEAETISLDVAEYDIYIRNAGLFERLGFLLEPFGYNTLICRAAPFLLLRGGVAEAVQEIIQKLQRNNAKPDNDLRSKILFSIACRAAIKANHTLNQAEMEGLASFALDNDSPSTCPHGRPIVIKITKKQIEKQFKRIV